MLKLSNAYCYENGRFILRNVSMDIPSACGTGDADVTLDHCFLLPGFVDVHVHLREPGFCYKETIATGSRACARGGYSTVFAMPNLNPVIDSREHLDLELEAIRKDAVMNVLPYGAITVEQKGEQLAELDAMAPDVIAFSDDGHGVQSEEMMRRGMLESKRLGKVLVAHCEDNSLLRGGYIHDGEYARAHGHRGICSESEWGPIERDCRLAEETGCSYHVCHVSTKESVEVIRRAKARGVDVTCETAPHYILMSENDLQENGRFKMNPPLRGEDDRRAILEGILDGTIDMIATDHAPHSAEEKSRGLEKSCMGVVGIETCFPLLYTNLVKTGILSLEKLMELMVYNPRKRFHLPESQDFSVWDLEKEYTIDPEQFCSKGRATPFEGWKVFGENQMTIVGGKIVWQK